MYAMSRRYSDEQWKILTNADCVELANVLGLEIDEKKSNQAAWHIKSSGGLHVWRNGKGFYNHSTGEKGCAVQLVQSQANLSYREALDFIHDNLFGGSFGHELIRNANIHEQNRQNRYNSRQTQPPQTANTVQSNVRNTAAPAAGFAPQTYPRTPKTYQTPAENKGVFSMPDCGGRQNNAYAYLTITRKIDSSIVNFMMKQGKIKQEQSHNNCCFIGYDKNGIARSCALRGTYTKGGGEPFKGYIANSDKRFGFVMDGNSRTLKVFESPIDAMSNADLSRMFGQGKDRNSDTSLSLGGVGDLALLQHLEDFPDRYNRIFLCLDNDTAESKFAGQKACEDITKKLAEKYGDRYSVAVRRPANKDWNEDLVQAKTIMERTECTINDVVKMWKNNSVPDEFKLNKAGEAREESYRKSEIEAFAEKLSSHKLMIETARAAEARNDYGGLQAEIHDRAGAMLADIERDIFSETSGYKDTKNLSTDQRMYLKISNDGGYRSKFIDDVCGAAEKRLREYVRENPVEQSATNTAYNEEEFDTDEGWEME